MGARVGARHGAPVIDIRRSRMEPSDVHGIPFHVGDLEDWAAGAPGRGRRPGQPRGSSRRLVPTTCPSGSKWT